MASVGEPQAVDSLILVDHGFKINEAYYRNVMLLQQFPLAIRQIASNFFVFQQDSAQAHTALKAKFHYAMGSKLVRSCFGAGSKPLRSWFDQLRTCLRPASN